MENKLYKRRDFLGHAVKSGAAGMMISPLFSSFTTQQTITISQVIDIIIAEVPGGRVKDTVDTLKSGSGDQIVTGIVTTMFATVKVIEAAAKLKANFIIAHEPSFYNHPDETTGIENNSVIREKIELLEKHKIAIWRFHDHWHRMNPDGILHGVLLKTGWLTYNPKEENVFQIPAQPLEKIIRHLKQSLHIPHLRYIGDGSATCSRIVLMPGAVGGLKQMTTLIKSQADLLIVGESPEWETPEYIFDARALGKSISMIILGHAFSEEPGMEWLVPWLQPKLPGIQITHLASGEPYSWD